MLTVGRVLLVPVICGLLSSNIYAEQLQLANYDYLEAKYQRFKIYQKDFLAFASASRGGDGYSIPYDMYNTSSLVADYILTLQTLLVLHYKVACPSDRTQVWGTIKSQSDYYARRIDHFIDEVNLGLAHSKVAAVATSGTQMKQDLRELKGFLESLQLK